MNIKKIITVVLFQTILFPIIVFGGGVPQDGNTTYTHKRIKRSEINTVSWKKEVKTGDITWKVLGVNDIRNRLEYDYSDAALETKGRFVWIRFRVKNEGADIKYIYDLMAIDSRGRVYPICASAYAYLGFDEACLLVEVLPGTERNFTTFHDIPLNAENLALEVTDLNIPAKERAYIDLGL
jgi:hypothetical protein